MTQLNSARVTHALEEAISGLRKVGFGIGLAYTKQDGVLEQAEFFVSLERAEERIRSLVMNLEVKGFWIGCQKNSDCGVKDYEEELRSLLTELNKSRGFGAIFSAGYYAVAWDLSF